MSYYHLLNPSTLYNKSELKHLLQNSYTFQHCQLAQFKGYQLAHILEHRQLGLPSYDTDTYDDLFSRIRRLHIPHCEQARKSNRNELVRLLHAWEGNRTFEDFLELPAEIRVRVYEFLYMSGDAGYWLQQPALSRTCKLVRQECLPVFYSMNRFGIEVNRRGFHGNRVGKQLPVDVWPLHVAEKDMGLMRLFEVVLTTEKARVRIRIDLPTSDCQVEGDGEDVDGLVIKVWSITPEKYMTRSELKACQARVEEQMRPSIKTLMQTKGLGAFGTREIMQIALSAPRAVVPGQQNNFALPLC